MDHGPKASGALTLIDLGDVARERGDKEHFREVALAYASGATKEYADLVAYN